LAVFWRGPEVPALVDPDQRLSVGAIEEVNPPGLAGSRDALARLPVDHGVEEDDGLP
jgi:hypothetical protein